MWIYTYTHTHASLCVYVCVPEAESDLSEFLNLKILHHSFESFIANNTIEVEE